MIIFINYFNIQRTEKYSIAMCYNTLDKIALFAIKLLVMMAYREFLACSDPLAGPIGCFLCAGVEPVTNVERAGPRRVTGVTSKQGVSQRGLSSACWADDHYPRFWKFRGLLAKSQRKEGQEQQMSSWPHNAHVVLGV